MLLLGPSIYQKSSIVFILSYAQLLFKKRNIKIKMKIWILRSQLLASSATLVYVYNPPFFPPLFPDRSLNSLKKKSLHLIVFFFHHYELWRPICESTLPPCTEQRVRCAFVNVNRHMLNFLFLFPCCYFHYTSSTALTPTFIKLFGLFGFQGGIIDRWPVYHEYNKY